MKFMLSLLAFGYVALANPAPSLPVNPGGIGGLFKGPNSEIIIKGPDGSIITAAAEGGEVQTNLEPILVAEPAIVQDVASVAIAAAPVIEAVAVPAPVVESKQSSDLIGPSGRIATQGSQSVVAGPASTTVTGFAIVAETVVKGPSFIGAPVLGAATPIGISAVPVAVTPASLAAEIAPISVTASSLGAITALPSLVTARGLISATGPNLATVTATPSVTVAPPIAVTAAPQAIATASISPHLSIASVSSVDGASISASAARNQAVETVGAISTVSATPLPIFSTPAHGLVGINTVDLARQAIQNQIAIDNRQLNLNPALIPRANIIPPEIAVTPRLPVGRLRPTLGPLPTLGLVPTPGTLLTTPGLGAVGTETNIQREEADTLTVTPNVLQITPQAILTPQQLAGLQSQQALLNNQIQQTQTAIPSNVQRDDVSLGVTQSTLHINPQVTLTQGQLSQLSALQNQQILLNNQIQHAQQAGGPGTLVPSHSPTGQSLFTPNLENRQVGSLANIPQQGLLSAELAKAGIDASQVQLTNVPLSAVASLPPGSLKGSGINDGLTAEAWRRFSRDAEKKKKTEEKTKSN